MEFFSIACNHCCSVSLVHVQYLCFRMTIMNMNSKILLFSPHVSSLTRVGCIDAAWIVKHHRKGVYFHSQTHYQNHTLITRIAFSVQGWFCFVIYIYIYIWFLCCDTVTQRLLLSSHWFPTKSPDKIFPCSSLGRFLTPTEMALWTCMPSYLFSWARTVRSEDGHK